MKLIVKYACRAFNPEDEGHCSLSVCSFYAIHGPCDNKRTVEVDLSKIRDVKRFLFYYVKELGRE